MSRQFASRLPQPTLGFSVIALVALAGCEGLEGISPTSANAEASGAATVLRVEERDVERPDLLEVVDEGLWDGRFSFGDRWVAVARPVQAERVRITNLSNGRTIEGALFQKDESRPGPPITVSQKAAEALDMFPGTPVEMRVVVLRRETVEVPAPAGAEGPADGTAVAAATAETIDGAVAATETAGATAEAAAEATVEDIPAEETAAAVAAVGDAPAAAPAASQAAPLPAVKAVTTVRVPGTVLPIQPEPTAEVAPAPEAAPADVTPALDVRSVTTSALEAAEASAASDAAPAAPGREYIQVASGTNEQGANAALGRLTAAGLAGEVRADEEGGATVYRVVAGPFPDAESFQAALASLTALGYGDAFAVN